MIFSCLFCIFSPKDDICGKTTLFIIVWGFISFVPSSLSISVFLFMWKRWQKDGLVKFAELVKLEDKGVSTAPLFFYIFLFLFPPVVFQYDFSFHFSLMYWKIKLEDKLHLSSFRNFFSIYLFHILFLFFTHILSVWFFILVWCFGKVEGQRGFNCTGHY